MNLSDVETIATNLIDEHLDGWSFAFDNARQRAGCCRYDLRRITLSRHIMGMWDASEVENTIRHEIAHALAGHGTGHGPAWRNEARRLGIKPERCYSAELPRPSAAWVGYCPNGHEYERHRLTAKARRGSCAECAPYFDEKYKIVWERR